MGKEGGGIEEGRMDTPVFKTWLRPWLWPMVYVLSHRASPLFGQINLFTKTGRSICVWTTCPQSLHESGTAGSRIFV